MSFLVVPHPLIHVLVSPPEHAVDQDGELVRHRRDRFWRAQFAPEATVLGAEVALAAEKGCGGDAEGGRRAIDDAPGASPDHFPARDPIIGTHAQPRSEVMLVLPAGHVESNFADDGLRDADINAVDARQIDAADPLQFAAQVELRCVTASLPATFGVRRTASAG